MPLNPGRWVSQQRADLIMRQARPHLAADEEILHWVRAGRVGGSGEGFIYLTDSRCIVAWPGSQDFSVASWADIETWGLVREVRGGPILGFEAAGKVHLAQIVVTTRGQASAAMAFVRQFADRAPEATRRFEGDPDLGAWETDPDQNVFPERRSVAGYTRRLIVTILGVALLVGALLIVPLPGPWSFLVTIGALAILAREYDWAKDLLMWTKEKFEQAKAKVAKRRAKRAAEQGSDPSA